jgi:SAM-dependent methyltransferase
MTGVSATSEAAIGRVREFFKNNPVRENWPWRHWNAHPTVARAINRRISGSPATTLHQSLTELLPRFGLSLPAGSAVSLGCGRGRQDRSLHRHGIVEALIGYDLSPDSIEAAAKWARSSGIDGFEYRLGDLNDIELEAAAFDFAIAEMSLHHVTDLERLFEIVARALKPGGLLLVDEYVGPTRFRWTEAQMRAVNGLLAILPDAMHMTPDGVFKSSIIHMPDSFFESVDPSEAVRSGEVMRCLEQRFEVLWRRPYGGTILHPLLHDIACNFREGDVFSEGFLDMAIGLEDTMMLTRDLDSDFIALVARPRE